MASYMSTEWEGVHVEHFENKQEAQLFLQDFAARHGRELREV